MTAIFKRELRSFFNSMVGYIFIAAVLVIIGIYFMAYNLTVGYPYFSHTMVSSVIIFIFTVPVLTMKSFAEERRTKTDQMFLTYPVSVGSVVMGKYLAMVSLAGAVLLFCCTCPLIISTSGNWYPLTDYCTILAVFVLVCLFISVGMYISSLTDNQIIAAVGTMVALLVIYWWDSIVSLLPVSASGNFVFFLAVGAVIAFALYNSSHSLWLGIGSAVVILGGTTAIYLINSSLFEGLALSLLSSFSCTAVLYNFAVYSVFDLGGLFLFASLAALFVFLTVQSVQKRRWR